MREPTGELFQKAKVIRSEVSKIALQEASRAAQIKSEERARQKLIDQQKKAEKKLSDERAAAFIEIMMQHKKQVPPTAFFPMKTTPETSPGASGLKDTNEIDLSKPRVGLGWVLHDGEYFAYSFKYQASRIERGEGFALFVDGTTHRVATHNGILGKRAGIRTAHSYAKRSPFNQENPFANDEGYSLLANYISASGIPIPEEPDLKDTNEV